jgi:chromosome segregation ATPase
MKVNPFNKKTNGYVGQVKAEHGQLTRQLEKCQQELLDAEAEHARERAKQTRLRDAAGSLSLNTPPAAKAHWPVLCAANERVERLKSQVEKLIHQIRPLARVLEAPAALAQARHRLDDVRAQDKVNAQAWDKTEVQVAKLTQRITELETRIVVETNAASSILLASEGEFEVPEGLTKLEVELRLARATLAGLHAEQETLKSQRQALPQKIKAAISDFQWRRAEMAEVELYEQLHPLMRALALASAAKRQIDYDHREDRFVVEIPQALIEAAQTALAAEISDA